jgi:hypothetical protein
MVPHLTDGALAAGPNTRVPAVEIKASQAGGALVVVFTVSFLAGHIGIALVAGRTFAHRPPALGRAAGRQAAGTGLAGVRLGLTARDGVPEGHIAGQAAAHRVALPVDLAAGVRSTGAGLTGVGWRGARLYLGAAGDGVRLGGEAGQAGAHRVAQTVHGALGIWSTWRGLARIRTHRATVVLADVAAAAIRIPLALPTAAGDGIRLRDIGGQAAADRVAIAGHGAFCVGAAGRGVARVWLVCAAVVQADAAAAAVGVALALPFAARDGVGHGDEAGQAAADGVAGSVGHALGVGSTGGGGARIRLHHTPLTLNFIKIIQYFFKYWKKYNLTDFDILYMFSIR